MKAWLMHTTNMKLCDLSTGTEVVHYLVRVVPTV